MLKEYKDIFISSASVLKNHKEMTQIELAEGYLEGGPLKDSYLAALVLRYWNMIEKLIYKDYGLYDPKEAYDWFMDSLLYIMKEQSWRDPNSTIYNDPKGIEKALNTCIKCSRANWFQASNRHKRKINHGISSLDALSEEYKDAYVPKELVLSENVSEDYIYLVVDAYNKQQYLLSLIIDIIVNDLKLEKCVDNKSLIFNIKKSIRTLPKNYSTIFAKIYGFDEKQVEKSFSYIYNMSDLKLRQGIENYIYMLKKILTNGDE